MSRLQTQITAASSNPPVARGSGQSWRAPPAPPCRYTAAADHPWASARQSQRLDFICQHRFCIKSFFLTWRGINSLALNLSRQFFHLSVIWTAWLGVITNIVMTPCTHWLEYQLTNTTTAPILPHGGYIRVTCPPLCLCVAKLCQFWTQNNLPVPVQDPKLSNFISIGPKP